MSNYLVLDMQFQSRDCLRQALMAVGIPFTEVELGQSETHLYGYQGDRRPETATFVIRRQNVGLGSNDIGWHWEPGLRAFVPVVSAYDTRQPRSMKLLQRDDVERVTAPGGVLQVRIKGRI
jgi:hypothetical protein